MPGANLTRIEAEERKSIIAAPIHYTVKLDLTRGAKDFRLRNHHHLRREAGGVKLP